MEATNNFFPQKSLTTFKQEPVQKRKSEEISDDQEIEIIKSSKTIDDLPAEIFLNIFSFLPENIPDLSLVSKGWKSLATDDGLMKNLIRHQFPYIQIPAQSEDEDVHIYDWMKKEIDRLKNLLVFKYLKDELKKTYGNMYSLPLLNAMKKLEIEGEEVWVKGEIDKNCKRLDYFSFFEDFLIKIEDLYKEDQLSLLIAIKEWEELQNYKPSVRH